MDEYRDRQAKKRWADALEVQEIMREANGLPDTEVIRRLRVTNIRSANAKIAAAKQHLGDKWTLPPRITEHRARILTLKQAREEKYEQVQRDIEQRNARRRELTAKRTADRLAAKKAKAAENETETETTKESKPVVKKYVPKAERDIRANRKKRLTEEEIEAAIGPLDDWKQLCHGASLALVESGLVAGRVARGFASAVAFHQHSWVVLGDDPYDHKAEVLDVTAWSYNDLMPRVLYSPNLMYHRPHGYGHWTSARQMPRHMGGPTVVVKLNLSPPARRFLEQFGPLDAAGWAMVAKLPVQGWPAKEIINAMLHTRQLMRLVPIDIQGMLTNRNPGGLYLPKAK